MFSTSSRTSTYTYGMLAETYTALSQVLAILTTLYDTILTRTGSSRILTTFIFNNIPVSSS
jgi:hypothetical protein